MKKKWMKFTSMLLAAVMVLSMAMTGLAAEVEPMASSSDTEGSITINNAAVGETYTIYKLFDLTYANDNSSYSYKVVSDWESFISSYTITVEEQEVNLFIIDDNGYLDPSSPIFDEKDDSEVMAAFAQAALAYATTENDDIIATATQTATSGTLKFSNLDLGYYLVDTTLGSLCFLDSTDPDATINEKNTPSWQEKEEYDSETDEGYTKEDTAEVGDTINYEVFLHDIAHAVNLVMHETMTTGLTFDKSSVEVYIGYPDPSVTDLFNDDSTEWTDITDSNYYTQDNNPEDECTFELYFSDDWLNTLSSGAVIRVTYNAVVNENAIDENNLWAIQHNDVVLTFGQDSSSSHTITDTDLVGFKILKYTTEGETEVELAGAEFELYCDAEHKDIVSFIPISIGGSVVGYEEVDPTTYTGSGTPTTTIVAGSVYVKGLHEGTYYLTETKAPDGYNMLLEDVIVNISLTESSEGVYTETVTVDEVVASDDTAKIENNQGSVLPGTGGMGTTLFYIVGIVLMIGAAAFFVARKRISKEG